MDKNYFKTLSTELAAAAPGSSDKKELETQIALILKREYDINVVDVLSETYTNSEEYESAIRKHIPENFCLYPFVHFQLDPDGRSRPCCKYKVGASWDPDVPKLPVYNIGELWNQSEIQDLRRKFLRNERPEGCKACWDEEAAGIVSMRVSRENAGKRYPYATLFKNVMKPYPESLDLKLSNLCNLKCRICTPFLSTQWIKEVSDLNITDVGSRDTFIKNSREKFLENSDNEQVLKEWAPTITSMEFYGGEPLMQQEHDRILNIVAKYGDPSKIEIHYNTNGTICEEKFFKIWKNFKSVNISFSIDDINDRYEYERKNASWEAVISNLYEYDRLKKIHNVNLHTKIYITVGVLNVFYLDEILTRLKEFNMDFVLNNVHYPKHYAIFNIPVGAKDVIKEKLKAIDNVKLATWSTTVDQLINFMYLHEPDLSEFEKFWNKTIMHDEYRNESFQNVFSELHGLLSKYRHE